MDFTWWRCIIRNRLTVPVAIALLLLLFLVGTLCAAPAGADNGLDASITQAGMRGPRLQVWGTADQCMYLEFVFAPAGVDAPDAPILDRGVTTVGPGSFSFLWTPPPQTRGGTWEVSLWMKKVPREECPGGGCATCRRDGYHLEGLVLSRTGAIPAR